MIKTIRYCDECKKEMGKKDDLINISLDGGKTLLDFCSPGCSNKFLAELPLPNYQITIEDRR